MGHSTEEFVQCNEETPSLGQTRLLYRRVPQGWYNPGVSHCIPQTAFKPRRWKSDEDSGDKDGLSVNRADLISAEGASKSAYSGKISHVAEITVEAVLILDLSVVPKPEDVDPSHAIVPELNSLDYRDAQKRKRIEECALALSASARIVFEATGASHI